MVACVAIGVAAIFVVARVSVVGFDGFVAAGEKFAADTSVLVYSGNGYDGQFYYRMALEPFSTAERVDGIQFDQAAYRQQRLGYPLTAYALTIVTPLSTTESLVAINLVAIGVLAFYASLIAQRFGRSALYGLAPLAWPAFIFSLGMDLSDILAAALLFTAVYYLLKNQHTTAAVLLCAAVLTRETTVVVAVLALLVFRRWRYAAPISVLFMTQAIAWALWGELPILASKPFPEASRIAWPFFGLVEGTATWSLIDIAVFAALATVLWIGVSHYQWSLTGMCFAAYGILAIVLGTPVWQNWRGFSRATLELVIFAYMLRVRHCRIPDDLPSGTDIAITQSLPAPEIRT